MRAQRVDGGDLPTPGAPVMPTRIALPVRQQFLHQPLRRLAVIGALALDQRDGARERRAVAGTDAAGEGGVSVPWARPAGEGCSVWAAAAHGAIDSGEC